MGLNFIFRIRARLPENCFVGLMIIAIFFSGSALAENTKSICLNMIVKDESKVITRCLSAIKPYIDYWVIVDTGSNDGTQEIIRKFMEDVPGELHERPWKNFAHNRNEALNLTKGKADYLIFIDADEEFIFSPDFNMPELNKDFYFITTEYGGTKYGRVQIINNHLDWRWKGVLHEYLECPEAKTNGKIGGIINFVRSDGARSQDPKKYVKDAEVLEQGLLEDPDNSRYVFYLAQSYYDAGMHDKAIQNYEKRSKMGGWDQEIFWCLLQIAKSKDSLDCDPEDVIKSYWEAYLYRPGRAEPLYYLANYIRFLGDFEFAYDIAKLGVIIAPGNDLLFLEDWIYQYGLWLEFSEAAYLTERYHEAYFASKLILSKKNLPNEIIQPVQENLSRIHAKTSSN